MPDKIVNHFVLADGPVARYDYDGLLNAPDLEGLFSKMEYVKSINVLDPNNIETGHFYNKNGSHQSSTSYNCTNNIIPVSEGDVVRMYQGSRLLEARYFTAYNQNNEVVTASGTENTNTYTVPAGITGVRVSFYASNPQPMITINTEADGYQPYFTPYYLASDEFLNKYIVGQSENALNPNTITNGNFINNTTGSLRTDSNYAVSDYIPVSEGDVVVYTNMKNNQIPMRYVAAYNENKMLLNTNGAENASTYTVPSGVSFIRISVDIRYFYNGIKDGRVNLNGVRGKYQEHYYGTVNELAQKAFAKGDNLVNYPLATLPKYVINAMAYRPLGTLSKGYLCLVSDDGNDKLATYTIPMLINKGVPCTFAVMKSSRCWEDNTNKATVIDAVENHNCEIAQHGGQTWDNYDEYTLSLFFDDEQEFFESLGLTPYGAVCPAHIINNTIRVVAGGRFGCVRTGYYEAEQYYPGYLNGERSNQFGLTSFNIIDASLSDHQAKIDAANTNHWLYMIHFHENEMDTAARQKLEAVIDYAKQSGITFITMKDIPTIV